MRGTDLERRQCHDDACPARPADQMFHELGTRVPLIAIYASGEPITIRFANGPGHPRDWIGVYPSGTTPAPVSTIWGYVGGGGFTATSGRTDGAITLAAGSENHAGDWPLHAGRWVAWFLVNDGYSSVASVEFTVL